MEDKTDFEAAVKKQCPHYNVLKDVMEDTHYSKAHFESDAYHYDNNENGDISIRMIMMQIKTISQVTAMQERG